MNRNNRIFVAGHRGMVGSAIIRRLERSGYARLLTRSRTELDLLDQRAVHDFLQHERPDYIFIAAARVGGIQANNERRADFLYQNLMIEANLIHGAHLAGVQGLMFLGSSCIYPRDCPQPIREEYLLTGPLEATNEPYALAKIAGLKLCESYNRQYGRQYVCLMPCNLYGPNDNYDPATSHVLPALLRRAHEAKSSEAGELLVWGTGAPLREFLHVDDLAEACVHFMETGYRGSPLNIGTGQEIAIRELAALIIEVVGFDGRLVFDPTKSDGTPRKVLDVSRATQLGWRFRTSIREGIERTYALFLSQLNEKNTTSLPLHPKKE